jgi:hypothetical protein
MSQHWQSAVLQRWAAVNNPLFSPFIRGDGHLALPKPVRSAILAWNSRDLANIG